MSGNIDLRKIDIQVGCGEVIYVYIYKIHVRRCMYDSL